MGKLQNELQEWEEWWGEEEPPPQQQEAAGQQPANAEFLQPTTPQPPPITPPVLRGQAPAQFLPPTSLPCIDAVMPPRPAMQNQGVWSPTRAGAAASYRTNPYSPNGSHYTALTSHTTVIQRTMGQPNSFISLLTPVSQAPTAAAGPWSRTREVYRNAAAASTPHVDPFSIPMSAGVSEASAGPTTNQLQLASGSAA